MAELCDIVKLDERKRAKLERQEKARLKAEALLNPKSREPTPVQKATTTAPKGPQTAPQMVLVDGRLILDVTSLAVNRQTIDHGDLESIEENSKSRLVNSATYGKREKSNRWKAEETERFYEGLARFGTDFEMLRSFCPGRSRKMLREKFKREERTRGDRITEALRGGVMRRMEGKVGKEGEMEVDREGTATTEGTEGTPATEGTPTQDDQEMEDAEDASTPRPIESTGGSEEEGEETETEREPKTKKAETEPESKPDEVMHSEAPIPEEPLESKADEPMESEAPHAESKADEAMHSEAPQPEEGLKSETNKKTPEPAPQTSEKPAPPSPIEIGDDTFDTTGNETRETVDLPILPM